MLQSYAAFPKVLVLDDLVKIASIGNFRLGECPYALNLLHKGYAKSYEDC